MYTDSTLIVRQELEELQNHHRGLGQIHLEMGHHFQHLLSVNIDFLASIKRVKY